MKSLSENLMINMNKSRKVNAKHLAGGVALPCMLATSTDIKLHTDKPQDTVSDSSRDELSNLLGISNDDEGDENDDDCLPCATQDGQSSGNC